MTLAQASAVLFVLALLTVLLWTVRRTASTGGLRWRGRDRVPAPLRLTGRVPLTPTHALHQIETAQGERYLLATYPGGVAVLSTHPAPLAAHAKGQAA